MAKQTAAQKAAAAKKRAEAKAMKDAEAAKAAAEATTTDAKPDTDNAPQTDAKAGADTDDKTTQPPEGQKTVAGDTKDQDTLTVFDQAVGFSLACHKDGKEAPDARELWEELGCDDMPAELAVAVFDCAVAQGAKVAQRLFGKVADRVEDAVADGTVAEVVTAFLAWRLRRYAFTGNAATQMCEWSKHILNLHAFIIRDLKA